MKKIIYLALAVLLLASISSANASGVGKHHHGRKAANHAAGRHHNGHHAGKHHHHRHA